MKKLIGVLAIVFLVCGCATSHLENGKESVVKFEEGGISAEDLYENLKEVYGYNALVNLIDTEVLSRKYEKTQAEDDYVNQVVQSLKNTFGDSFESYIKSSFGVKDEKGLKEYARLMYRKDLWNVDYAKSQVNDTQIDDYYRDVQVGDITASHILIESKATDDMTAEEQDAALKEAYDKAVQVIDRLNNGEDFATVAKEVSDYAGTKSNGGALGTFNYKDHFDKNFMEEAVKLEVGTYSKTPVKSQYGYHIIYKTAQAEKAKLEDVKDDIISIIAEEMIENDPTLPTKAIVALRKEYGMDITDSQLKSEYDEVFGE